MTHSTSHEPEKPRRKLNIFRETPKIENGEIIIEARLECDGETQMLTYRTEERWTPSLTESYDPFVVACLLMAMQKQADIHAHGLVSPQLIENLQEWQMAWHSWRPDKYFCIEITADSLQESDLISSEKPLAIAAFTGGIDSTFTIARHCRPGKNQAKSTIGAGLLVHGFDIPQSQPEAFQRAAEKARHTLKSVDVDLITMVSNHKDLNIEWNDTHGIGIASCLMLFKKKFGRGIIASTHSYDFISVPWGSNPITDWMLSSRSFEIRHDGADTSRPRKARLVSQWPEAWGNLRVCYSADRKDENCGKCTKCVITALGLLAVRLDLPPSMPKLNPEDILALTDLNAEDFDVFETMHKLCSGYGFTDPWMKPLERCVQFNRRRRKICGENSTPKTKMKQLQMQLLRMLGP